MLVWSAFVGRVGMLLHGWRKDILMHHYPMAIVVVIGFW
jgi:hypothetical protein